MGLNMNDRQLREAVNKHLNRPLTDDEWSWYEPDDYVGVFDEEDIKDILRVLPKDLIKTRRQGIDTYYRGSLMPLEFTVKLQHIASSMRELLGLSEPLPFDKLENTLAKLNVNESLLRLYYPVAREVSNGIVLWQIKSIQISEKDKNLVRFKYYVDGVAERAACHPALVLAYFLCEIPLYMNDTVVFLEGWKGHRITLQIISHSIPLRRILKAYSLARDFVSKTIEPIAKRKENKSTGRITYLYYFIKDNTKLSWDERLKKWNSLYSDQGWNYASVQSMQVVYSRIRKREKEKDEEHSKFIREMLALNPFKSFYKREFDKQARKEGDKINGKKELDRLLGELERQLGISKT